MTQEEYNGPVRRPERNHRNPDEGKLLMLRNILNIIFMICAVIGVGVYLKADHNTGLIIVMFAMVIKFAESAIRFLRH